jgi:hypothetical protein
MGVDPLNPDNNIFNVEMTSSTLIPVSLVNTPGATLRLGAFFASDCSSLDNYSIVPMSTASFGFSAPLNSNPCTRNDKAWFQGPGIVDSNAIGISGYDPLGICPIYAAGSRPSYQEVQYSVDAGPWTNYKTFFSLPSLNNSRFVSSIDFAKSDPLPSGTYTIRVRYRNVKLNTGVPFGTLPTISNSCSTTDWSEETYPNIVIP